eukprot:294940_1
MASLARFQTRQRYQRLVFLSTRYCHCEMEEWRDIAISSKHQVSSLGRFRNKFSHRLLTINYGRIKRQKRQAYMALRVDGNGKIVNLSVGRTVLSTFFPIEENYSLYAVHIDGDKYNNKLSNLTWSESHVQFSSIGGGNKVSITLKRNNEIWQFESRKHCKSYLLSVNIDISVGTISILC